MKLDLKKSEFPLFVFGFPFTIINKKYDLLSLRKLDFEVGLCNLMTYVFKGLIKIVKICMVKFNASILNRLKIMGICKYKVNT